MNNEPVAWMAKKEAQNGLDDFFEHSPDFPDWQIEEFKEAYIPLYTHPAKETNYKFGVDWGKDDKSVTVVKIHEDGVAEIVFVDYQERTHPAKPTKVKFASDSCESGWIYLDYEEPAKTLTDEEILQFRDKVPYSLGSDLIEFARAILRKAQEK